MSSSKNRGKGSAEKPRPKKTTAKKAAPGQTPRGQATGPSVTAQATDGDIEAAEAAPKEVLAPAGQATNDDEISVPDEPQPDEPPADGETERLNDAAPASNLARAPEADDHAAEAPQDDSPDASIKAEVPDRADERDGDDEGPEPGDTAPERAQGSTAVEPSQAVPSEQRPVDDARPTAPSGTTAAAPAPARALSGSKPHDEGHGDTATGEVVVAKARDESVDGTEHTDDIGGNEDGAEIPDATVPSEGGRRKALGKVFAGLLAVGLGFAVMTQVRQHEKSGLDKLSQADLVALLADVNAQSSRLNTELDELRATKQKLDSGGDSAAVADAQKRLDQLAVLNGTTKVKGPGIVISVTNTRHEVSAANVLDAVEELRDAGAESIEVDGTRVVASTWFSDQDERPTVGGHPLNDTFTIRAIGDPHTMSTAMAIPGGVTDTLAQAGAQVKVTEDTSMQINSVVASTR